jgi:hypothetical protein
MGKLIILNIRYSVTVCYLRFSLSYFSGLILFSGNKHREVVCSRPIDVWSSFIGLLDKLILFCIVVVFSHCLSRTSDSSVTAVVLFVILVIRNVCRLKLKMMFCTQVALSSRIRFEKLIV